MKQFSLMTLLLATFATATTSADESDKISITNIGMAGNGCPEETGDIKKIITRQNDHSVHIISPYFALPEPTSKRTFSRYKCDVAVSLEVANGYQVGINASAKGFITLGDDAKSTVKLSSFFAGSRSEPEEKTFDSPTLENFELSNTTTQWSACGADSILRMKVSASLRDKDLGQSHLRINSFGMELEHRECSDS